MRRIETIHQAVMPELGSVTRLPTGQMSLDYARKVRAVITEIYGFRSEKAIKVVTQRNSGELRSIKPERKRGSGGRCRRKGIHEHGGCGSPNCRAPKSLPKNNKTAEGTIISTASIRTRTMRQKIA